jgi:hypothetical protein
MENEILQCCDYWNHWQGFFHSSIVHKVIGTIATTGITSGTTAATFESNASTSFIGEY